MPHQLPFRLAALAGYPLFTVPRFRDVLVVQARKPGLVTTEDAVEARVNAGVA
jgi:hypothetical protein